MVVAQEVKHAMDQQAAHLAVKSAMPHLRLAPGGGHRDHHVSEDPRVSRGKRAQPVLGKGEHVGGPVLLAVVPVEDLDRRVVDEEDRELGAGEAQRSEQPLPIASNGREIEEAVLELGGDQAGHVLKSPDA